MVMVCYAKSMEWCREDVSSLGDSLTSQFYEHLTLRLGTFGSPSTRKEALDLLVSL